MTPTKVDAYNNHDKKIVSELYPKFNAFIYSLETFVPLVKLGVSDYWTPNSNCGAELRCLRKRLLPLFKRAWVERYRTACAEAPVKSPAPRNIISKGVRFLRRCFLFFIRSLEPLRFGGLLRCYLWVHMAAGWVLTTLWVIGLTGLLKT